METLFSQFKHTAGEKLSAVNYETACAAHLVKHTVEPHHSGKEYRNVALSIPQGTLEKKKYNKSNKLSIHGNS